MKYLVLIGDGMSDLPLKQLGGKTPLAAAKTPNLDFLAQHGICGLTNNVPPGLEPGSDVAAMSIFGYDPKKYYSGRGPLEAASLGVKLKENEVAFRCNLVTVKDGKMGSFTAHQIATAEAARIIKTLNEKLGSKTIKFYPGLSYRNLLIMSNDKCLPLCGIPNHHNHYGIGKMTNVKTIAPHDITGKSIQPYLPKSELLIRLMNESEVIIHGLRTKATMIWPWGQGVAPKLQSFKAKFKKRAAIITAVHLLKGLGKILGMKVINVPGATGYLDTNYLGKAEAAIKALKDNDIVFVHVEAPDEAGHEGDVRKKIRAIEDFDKLVVGAILKVTRLTGGPAIRILVLPDHPTPIKYMTHTRDDVPFVIYGAGIKDPFDRAQGKQGSRVKAFNEKEVGKAGLRISAGHKLLRFFLQVN